MINKTSYLVVVDGQTICAYLDAIVNTGLYGNDPQDAVQRLVCEGIERAIREGVIPRAALPVSYKTTPMGRDS